MFKNNDDLCEHDTKTDSEVFEKEKPMNMLSGKSCEMNQLFFARLNLCGITWGDIVLALKDFRRESRWANWDGWHRNWIRRANVFENQGIKSLNQQHYITARDAFLRSAACYHFSEFMYFDNIAAKEAARNKVTELFFKAIPYIKYKVQPLFIPFENLSLPGYLVIPKEGDAPFPCVILNNGLDSAKEVELFAFARQFLERGLSVLLFDGPGQGELLGKTRMVVEWENVIGAVLAEVNHRKEIDQDRIGMFGVSFGGYLCARGAAFHQQRIKAAINLSGCYDMDNLSQIQGTISDGFCYVFQMEPEAMNILAHERINLRSVPSLERPLLSIHSKIDSVFPFETAQRVHEWASGEKELITYDHEWHVCINYFSEFIPMFCDWMADRL